MLEDEAKLFLEGGIFNNNNAADGGVVFIEKEGSQAVVTGGNYSGNKADNGGVFYVEKETNFTVSQEGCREMTRQLVCFRFDIQPSSVRPFDPPTRR